MNWFNFGKCTVLKINGYFCSFLSFQSVSFGTPGTGSVICTDPDPSIIMQKSKKNFDFYCSAVTSKVPKRENFSLSFFALSEPIWVCDLGTGEKIEFFINWPLILMVFGFLPHTECGLRVESANIRLCTGLRVESANIWLHTGLRVGWGN